MSVKCPSAPVKELSSVESWNSFCGEVHLDFRWLRKCLDHSLPNSDDLMPPGRFSTWTCWRPYGARPFKGPTRLPGASAPATSQAPRAWVQDCLRCGPSIRGAAGPGKAGRWLSCSIPCQISGRHECSGRWRNDKQERSGSTRKRSRGILDVLGLGCVL